MQYRLSKQQKQEVCQIYQDGKSSNQISEEYGISSVAVLGILKRRGIKVRSQQLAQRKHSLWHPAFDKLTPQAMYWIGFIFADGTIIKRSGSPEIAIVLSELDKSHLSKFKRFLKAGHKLIKVNNQNNGSYAYTDTYRFCVRSENLANKLEEYGWKNKLNHKAIEQLKFSTDFWGGVIDGDGVVTNLSGNRSHQPRLELVGGFELLGQFVDFVKHICPNSNVSVKPHKSIFRVNLSCNTAFQVIKALYSNSDISLERKQNAAINILTLGLQSLGNQSLEAATKLCLVVE